MRDQRRIDVPSHRCAHTSLRLFPLFLIFPRRTVFPAQNCLSGSCKNTPEESDDEHSLPDYSGVLTDYERELTTILTFQHSRNYNINPHSCSPPLPPWAHSRLFPTFLLFLVYSGFPRGLHRFINFMTLMAGTGARGLGRTNYNINPQ